MTLFNKTREIQRHEPPGNLDDLTDENKTTWSKCFISHWIEGEISADSRVVEDGRTPLTQFFESFNAGSEPILVTWNAFPKLISDAYPDNNTRWAIADASRMVQDEYLEWSVNRGERKISGDIISVTMTCEGPEYWQFLASCQKQDFINLMRDLNPAFRKQMQDGDFFLTDFVTKNEVYNPANSWNLLSTNGCIAHLIQPNNTLSAEVDIAAQATVIRKSDDGKIITDKDKLIRCSKYGNPGRNSDPTIGYAINTLARKGQKITLAEPVALYVSEFDTSSFRIDPNGTTGQPDEHDLLDIDNPSDIFQWTRGDIDTGHGLRLHIEMPEDMNLNVSNLYDINTQQHIRYGAQFADYITMTVGAVTASAEAAAPQRCFKNENAYSAGTPCSVFEGLTRASGSSRA
ncbi:hypothetical protein AAL_07958 [Moelleriella libera RCEF 2490]|uniref:Uncharacterized protein n=1 Tax=Moelleriella libera RCEF 2490 TaxID=1081109 RepID=A0A167WEX4_9HYPO|nr:hypothetical protein AAL_07958 [Moelleriella libera RCEF 2490]